MSQHSDLFAPVLEALTADQTTEFGAPGARVQLLRRVDRLFSSVQRVRIQTPVRTTHAYIKILKPRRPGQEELARIDRMLKREYLATRAFYEALPPDAFIGAVRPLAWLPEYRAIATEEVPGRLLDDLLREATHATDELLTVMSRVGAWARVYQNIGEGAGVIELVDCRAYLDDRLKLLAGRVLSAADRQDALERFDMLASRIGATEVPAVPIHADLAGTNIIVDEKGRVTVLDFTMAKAGPSHHDLSHVYFHLEMMAARHRGRRAMFRALQAAMLNGYSPGLSAEDPLFRLMLLQHSVCHVALLAERRVPIVDIAYRWFLKRRWQICEQIPRSVTELRVA
jgi:hypothetical protein